jgi:hypothetical protein
MPLLRLAALACIVAGALGGAGCKRDSVLGGHSPQLGTSRTAPVDAKTWHERLGHLARTRETLALAFRDAKGEARAAVRAQAARALEDGLVDTVLPRWDGTPWSFDGTSTAPGTGSIACGYFVSTALLEAGLHVERIRLSQQASERIIETLVPSAAIARFSNVPIEHFVAAVAQRGDGLYIVGLDNHVGFLVVREARVFFHHSSYVGAKRVLREPAITAIPLVTSRYRVIGKLFTDSSLVDAWLEGTTVHTRSKA